jgi:hypothetical protein
MRGHLRAIALAGTACVLAMISVPGSAHAATVRTSGTPTAHANAEPSSAPSVLQSALLTAKATGHTVPVPADTTQTSTTVALPDGKFSTTTSVLPVRMKRNGSWVPVNASLIPVAGGYSPAATPSDLVLSLGGTGPVAVMATASGTRLAFTFPFRLPSPSVAGATATYANVLPGVNLAVTANSQGGFGEVLVIKDAAAAANPALRQLKLATSTTGLTVRTDATGNMTAVTRGGKAAFVSPAPQMWDSGARPSAVPVRMHAEQGGLVLVPDQRMLTGASTRFPVVIDPEVNPASSGVGGYVETQQGCPTYNTWDTAQTNGEGVGYENEPGSACEGLYRSFYQFDTENLNSSMVVSSATMLTAETYGSDLDCSDTWPVTVKWTDSIHDGTDWSSQPGVLQSIQTMDPKTAWCGTQDVDFNVTSEMQSTAEHNDTQLTVGLYGDEADLPNSSCSPSSEYNCGFMRFNSNPSITTVFDIAPDVPSNTGTTPASADDGVATGPGCGSNTVGWIGATDLGAGNGSDLTLNATVTSNIVGEHVRAEYTVWDNSIANVPVGSNVVANPDSAFVASGTTVDTPVGIALHNGHAYGWRVAAYDGILTSADAPDCHFDVDTTPPTVPTVTSTTFPASGTNPTSPPITGATGTFSFASTDPVPTGCDGTCLSSGVGRYEYSFNTPIPTSGASTVAAGGTVSYTANRWGTNILYVAAVDNAGNVSQARQYDFYVKWNPQTTVTAGDINGDGIPDLLETDTAGNLLLYQGGSDPAVSPTVAGTPATSPAEDHSGWNTYQITHRGSMSEGSVDDLFAHKGANLYLYLNNQADPGEAPQFGQTADINQIYKPSCAATAGNADNCTGYDATDWSEASQILAPGDVYGNSLPDLLTVEDGQLWLYKGEFSETVDTPVQLGSSGWGNVSIIAPGDVNGTLTLWARDDSSGVIYSWPLTLDSNGEPELGTASVGAPVTATSGTVVSGVTLTSAAYPTVISSGPLTGGTCAAADLTACPGTYAEDNDGNLWYYEGQSASGGASPLSGSRVLVGNVDDPDADLPLVAGSGAEADDETGNGNNGTLEGSATWATDATRGTVISLDRPSGCLQLPDDLVSSTTTLSFSLWFKTSTAGQVLLSTGTSELGSSDPSTAAVPVLYIGTNGSLYGQLPTGDIDPMASTAAVDDGQWHHVVITGDTGSQSLYLDGQLVGSVGGTISDSDPLDYVGAGYVNSDGWVNAPAAGWSYFDGEVSDIEYYTYSLNPDEITALYGGQDDVTQLG